MAVLRVVFIGWLLSTVASAGGQLTPSQGTASPPQANQQPGMIDGRVTNSLTGDLVPGATVRLRVLRYAGGNSRDSQAHSQADGSFHFDSVAPGEYIFTAECEGFISNELNTRSRLLSIQPGQAVTGITLQLTPAGSISGKVEDGDGNPVPGARVNAFKPVTTRGKTRLNPISNASADASGNFILRKLATGDYYVVAEPSLEKKSPEKAPAKEGDLVRTIYPRGLSFEDASTIQIGAGQAISDITVRLRRALTYHVRGKISEAPDGAKLQRLRVLIAPQGGSDARALMKSAVPAPDNSFDIGNVVPGSYTLRLEGDYAAVPGGRGGRRQSLLAREDAQVGAGNLEGIVLTIVPPITLRGRVTIDSSGVSRTSGFSGIRLIARPLEDVASSRQAFADVLPDGTFTLGSLDPGLYAIDVLLGGAQGGFYVKSLSFNQQDILHSEVDLSQGGTGEIEVILRSGSAEVDGSLRTTDGTTGPRTIVLVPEHTGPYGSGVLFSYSRPDGTFSVANVPPGKYFAYAAIQADPNLWRNPDFLRLIENGAVAVNVDENSRQQVQIQEMPLDQIAQAAGRLGLTLP